MPPSEQSADVPTSSASEPQFHVFLSHNSLDKPLVRELADKLIEYGVKPWLDERELVPGRPWQDALERIIATTRTAAVLFGPAGLGPWEEPEMRACLSQFVRRKLSVIPVLLPDAPEQPALPLFLQEFTWVDLRQGLTDEGIERLVWGITGEKTKKSNRSGNRKIGDAAAESIAADMRRWYGKHVGRTWDARWSDADADADTNQPEKLPPFIDSQGMRLLSELEDPRPYLRAEHFRAGRVARGGGDTTGQMPDAWMAVDRGEVARNSLSTEDGRDWDLSRLALTTDAGVGKTTTMEWFEVELNRGSGDRLAMLLTFRDLRNISGDGWADGLLPLLARRVIERVPGIAEDHARQTLEFLRDRGRLVLLLDGLDQASPEGRPVDVLRNLIGDVAWRACRIVVSGRPHALQRHWDDLFAGPDHHRWRFVQVDEFDESQQRQYLGRTAEGRERFEMLPLEDREILGTPRVLAYLRELPDAQLSLIHTQADVYWRAINHLLLEGMNGSREARQIGLLPGEQVPEKVQKRSLERAKYVLAAIAFAMTSTPLPARNDEGDEQPNFDGVPDNEFPAFLDTVYHLLQRRPGEGDRSRLERDVEGLTALNQFLDHGFFDTGVVGQDGVFWRNRTLQEFFTAYWLAQFCHEQDAEPWGGRVYCGDRPQSESYYWVWRFLCEMPDEARNPRVWSRAIEPVFRPGDGTIAGTCRSGELIYRAWSALEELVRRREPLAIQVQAAFWGEFESEILSGRRGEDAQRVARQFCDYFIDIPGGEFQMGAPPEKQGMPADLRRTWKKYLEREGDPAELAEQHLSQISYPPGKAGQQARKQAIDRWTRFFQDRDLEAILQLYYPANETPVVRTQEIGAFRLNRWPTVNAWYRIFDPGHGLANSWYRDRYEPISPDAETPAIYVSWYDAWAFCLWARWDGQSCRLPHENEWEYAAKAGTDWSWNYWWGDAFDPDKCNAEGNVGRTTRPDPAHANPWGLEDMLGNVWEWTEDEYRRAYDLDLPPDSSARVSRGGSWFDIAFVARSAFRVDDRPWRSEDFLGFRVARALPRKP